VATEPLSTLALSSAEAHGSTPAATFASTKSSCARSTRMPGCTKPDVDGIVVGTGRAAGAVVVVVVAFAVVVVGIAVVVVTVVVVGVTTTEPTRGQRFCASAEPSAGVQLASTETATSNPTDTTNAFDVLNG
jgi:hypothetical protein